MLSVLHNPELAAGNALHAFSQMYRSHPKNKTLKTQSQVGRKYAEPFSFEDISTLRMNSNGTSPFRKKVNCSLFPVIKLTLK